jgi:hypothetical protein
MGGSRSDKMPHRTRPSKRNRSSIRKLMMSHPAAAPPNRERSATLRPYLLRLSVRAIAENIFRCSADVSLPTMPTRIRYPESSNSIAW